eukprot:8642855-Prorocentrum_lima.AAC.1
MSAKAMRDVRADRAPFESASLARLKEARPVACGRELRGRRWQQLLRHTLYSFKIASASYFLA